jgi:hypothetical protein
MMQFYFLSILYNAVAGYALLCAPESKPSALDGLKSYLLNDTFRLVLGIMTMSTGFFKVLSSVRGDIPVIGDLFPAVAGLAAGFILVFEYYRARSLILSAGAERIEQLVGKHRKWFAYIALTSAGTHFMFPTVLFL